MPTKKYFLFVFNVSQSTIPTFERTNNKIGNSKDKPLANSKYIVSFIYSEYLDSKTTGTEPCRKFSKDRKKSQIIGIKKKQAKTTPQIKRIGIKKKVGMIIFFSFLYKAGYINNTICDIKKGNEVKI